MPKKGKGKPHAEGRTGPRSASPRGGKGTDLPPPAPERDDENLDDTSIASPSPSSAGNSAVRVIDELLGQIQVAIADQQRQTEPAARTSNPPLIDHALDRTGESVQRLERTEENLRIMHAPTATVMAFKRVGEGL